jgi:hypothetical protein
MFVDANAVAYVVGAALVLVNTLVNVWTHRKMSSVETKVNGLMASAIHGARLEGIVQGAGVALPPPPPGPVDTTPTTRA